MSASLAWELPKKGDHILFGFVHLMLNRQPGIGILALRTPFTVHVLYCIDTKRKVSLELCNAVAALNSTEA